MVVAVVAVAIIVIAAVAVVFTGSGNSDKDNAIIASQLQIRGNANDDHTIDSQDMAILEEVLADNSKLSKYPLADVNADGKVDANDKHLLQDLIDRKVGTTVYVICLDRSGNTTTVPCTYPLRNVVTYATNMQVPTLYANGGQYIAGYFSSSYHTVEKSISSKAEDLKGTQRKISDASWKNFTALDAKLTKGVGALLIDYSGVEQITDARESDLNAAGIPMIIYASADATAEITTVLTLGFLFGGECEKIGMDYAQKSWNVFKAINDKVGNNSDAKKSSYICFTMYIYICQNDSSFNSSAATAGGIPYYKINSDFASKYKGDSSTKMSSVEALSNYTDVDTLINNRSIDWMKDRSEANKIIVETWEHDNKGTPSSDFFKGFEDRLFYINNLLPGAVKVAYMAHALYADEFSSNWADGVLKEFIDIGTEPLKGQSTDTILAYFDYDMYRAAKAATA